MNTRNVYIHYLAITPLSQQGGSTFTFTPSEEVTALGRLVGGVIKPLACPGGAAYNPAYLLAPGADFRFMRPGESSPHIMTDPEDVIAANGVQLVVLSAGEFPPMVEFKTDFVFPPTLIQFDQIGYGPTDFDGPHYVGHAVYSDGTNGNVVYIIDLPPAPIGLYKGQMSFNGYRRYIGEVFTTQP